MYGLITTCDKCGKPLNGLVNLYGSKWTCSECIEDKTDVLHCENGCKVRCVTKDVGFGSDQKTAEVLEVGEVYTVYSVTVGSWKSDVCLEEFPNKKFNSVFFERYR